MKHKALISLLLVLLGVGSTIMIVGSLNYRQSLGIDTENVRPLAEVHYETADGEQGSLLLPATLNDLPPRTAVTLWAETEILAGESIFIKSVFAPLRVYINDELLYAYGKPGSYPRFLNDPPTGLAIVKLPDIEGKITLRAEYESLTQRSTLSLPAFYLGDRIALLERLLIADGFTFLFSLLLIFLGSIIVLTALFFVRRAPTGAAFLWLGLFSLAAGIWIFGECDFASRVFPYPALLYMLDYLGLFLVAIPFLHFGLIMLVPKDKRPIKLMLMVHYLSVVTAILLQLTGLRDFIKTLYWFHIITPLAFVLFAVCLLWEGLRHRNPAAKRFAPAILALTLATILELANYWLHFISGLTIFFQLGVLVFIVSLGVVSGYHVLREWMDTVAEKQKLEYEMANVEKQLALQRLQYMKLADDEERTKKTRHDLRHHLAVLHSLAEKQEELVDYIDRLMATIPSARHLRLCENYAVNAVAAYYYEQAEAAAIDIGVELVVPQTVDSDLELDLCVIVGNLLENALHACQAGTGKASFISLKSTLLDEVLTITADNSCGQIRQQNGVFLSTKPEGEGIGLLSITATAEKHGGGARFEAENGLFKASVYLNLSGGTSA